MPGIVEIDRTQAQRVFGDMGNAFQTEFRRRVKRLNRLTMPGACVLIGLCLLNNGSAVDRPPRGTNRVAHSRNTDDPLPIYHKDANHLWNRLFAALYIRPGPAVGKPDRKTAVRFIGGDVIDFLAWPQTTYWSSPKTAARLNRLIDEFCRERPADRIGDPLKRALMLRDLWAVYDFLTGQQIKRFGSLETRQRRNALCRKLAKMIESLALSRREIAALPDNYALALKSGRFRATHGFDARRNYLPAGLFTRPDEWAEIDFYQPSLHEDLSDRFITLHTRQFRGRSYFRIFYRFPKGRKQLAAYLKELRRRGVDWKQAAQNGFILLKKDAPQIPVGTEVALVQFMMTLDKELRPVPTKVVESVRLRTFATVDGTDGKGTNTGIGMNVLEYTLQRRLLFAGKQGGLSREPEDLPQYRVIFQPGNSPDWGPRKPQVLFQQCADCHTTPKADRTGVHSMPSIVHMGGFDAGAQLGIAVLLDPRRPETRGRRAAKWKSRHETYRRLLEHLGR